MTFNSAINPKFTSADNMMGAIMEIAHDSGYVIPVDAMTAIVCYIGNKEMSIQWNAERKVINVRNMHDTKEETLTVLELAERALDYASNHCHKDNPRCKEGLEEFIADPIHPAPIDPTDFQRIIDGYMSDATNSDAMIDLFSHAALMIGQAVGGVQNFAMRAYEDKSGISYAELMPVLAEILMSYVRLLTVSNVNMTEIMRYLLNIINH